MKNWLIVIFFSSLVVGCDSNQDTDVETTPINNEQGSINTPPSKTLIEYVWNKAGPEFSEEKLIELTKKWNDRIDNGSYDMTGANILRPRFESEDFDFIWVLLWPSEEARDAAWSDWDSNQAADWRKDTENVFDYAPEDVYGFEANWGYKTTGFNIAQGQTFEPNFSFCTFKEGHNQSTLSGIQARYNDWLEESNGENENTDPYAYAMLEAQFDQENVDFVWVDLFMSEEDKLAGEESWSGTELEKEWNDMATCQTFQFSATAIRR